MKGGLQDRCRVVFSRTLKGAVRGFTIIETLIVLAVTSGLFIVAAVAISGRQQRTQFDQSIQEIRSQIQQSINEVAVGYYPSLNNFTCTPSSSGPSFSAGNSEQGSNGGCVFIGKALQFKIAGTSEPEQFVTHTIAGLQKNTAGQEISKGAGNNYYIEAQPKVVPNVEFSSKLLYGLQVHEMYYGPAASKTPIGSFVIANKLASYSGASLISGSQQLNIIPITGSSLDADANSGATAINSSFVGSPLNPNGGISICLTTGAANRSGLITIGNNGRELAVTLKIKDNITCA